MDPAIWTWSEPFIPGFLIHFWGAAPDQHNVAQKAPGKCAWLIAALGDSSRRADDKLQHRQCEPQEISGQHFKPGST
jgi:hypothetical protein